MVNSRAFELPVMADREPKPRNPLGPYYPSEVPSVPGNGRRWLALLLVALILIGAARGLLALLPF